MKKLFFILLVLVAMQTVIYAQTQGLSEEGYTYWIRATTMLQEVKEDINYLRVIDEFEKVLEFDPNYADTYFNLGILYTKVGDLGGGIPVYRQAQVFYDKYLVLRPDEKKALTKELIQLDLKKENFLKNIEQNMLLVEEGIYKKKKSSVEVKVDSFYIQSHLFSLAEFKRLITPIAIRLVEVNTGRKFSIPSQESPTGDNNIPYLSNYITAEQIVTVINYVTDKHFFIPTLAHWERILKMEIKTKKGNAFWYIKHKGLSVSGLYLCPYYYSPTQQKMTVIEWINHSENNRALCFNTIDGFLYVPDGNQWELRYRDSDGSYFPSYVGFRLALPASEK